MDAKPLLIFGGLGLGAALLFGSRQGKAATPPVQRFTPPASAPPPPAAPVGEPHIHGASESLSKNFLIGEWLRSLPGYKLTASHFSNLLELANNILQPKRDEIAPSVIEITGGGRPVDYQTPSAIEVTNWQSGVKTTVPAGSSIEDIIRAQGYKPIADSDHTRFACADLIIRTSGKPDSALMEKAFLDWQKNPYVRQVGIYRVGKDVSHLHVAVIHPGHGKIEGTNFAYQTGEGE